MELEHHDYPQHDWDDDQQSDPGHEPCEGDTATVQHHQA